MVLCNQGIGVVPHDEFVKTGVITLTPWARVQGDLRIGRQKGVNRTLHLSRIARVQENVPMMSNETTTDADGRFVFERVYPGEFALYNQRYEVAPGQTLELHLGGAGRTVKGELILPGLGDTPIWAELYLAAPATPIPFEQLPKPSGYQEMSLGELEAWLERYGESQEGQAYIAWLQKMYPNMDGKGLRVEMDDRRAFHLDNVEPGVYALRGVVHRSPGFSGAQELEVLGRFWRQVVVPSITQESPLDVPLDLGAVTALPGDLKVGDPAPEFDVPTFGSERLRLLDYRGKVLLVGFYSRHYVRSPAVEDLKNTYRQFHENPALRADRPSILGSLPPAGQKGGGGRWSELAARVGGSRRQGKHGIRCPHELYPERPHRSSGGGPRGGLVRRGVDAGHRASIAHRSVGPAAGGALRSFVEGNDRRQDHDGGESQQEEPVNG